MSNASPNILVLGAGSWGTALAKLLTENNVETYLWTRDAAQAADMRTQRRNLKYLPEIVLPDALHISDDLNSVIQTSDIILFALPCAAFRDVLTQHAQIIKNKKGLVWACKGLEQNSLKRLDEVAREILGEQIPLATISGPNFAGEVARRVPTATTVAASSYVFAEQIVSYLHNDWFRAYSTDDLIGVQMGGALKNALAIAVGIADGLGLGANTRAALITRGLAEIVRLGVAMGGRTETFLGLAGMGDLVLTCTDDQSRNRRFGKLLAQGYTVEKAIHEIGQAVEGYKTAQSAHLLAKQLQIDAPIIEQTYQVLFENKPAQNAVRALLTRDPKPEHHR
ncbi:MAG: NAD(P)-dependent glycerol-3-phosphate dehydrogenase [Gammaproteobacteria bacterium]|nr:NAD(P)-dependent glycerol-3-phosphate dehydrogenase [Gammaproteobacteria bacterium]